VADDWEGSGQKSQRKKTEKEIIKLGADRKPAVTKTIGQSKHPTRRKRGGLSKTYAVRQDRSGANTKPKNGPHGVRIVGKLAQGW